MPFACPTLSVLAWINKHLQFVNYLTVARAGVVQVFSLIFHMLCQIVMQKVLASFLPIPRRDISAPRLFDCWGIKTS